MSDKRMTRAREVFKEAAQIGFATLLELGVIPIRDLPARGGELVSQFAEFVKDEIERRGGERRIVLRESRIHFSDPPPRRCYWCTASGERTSLAPALHEEKEVHLCEDCIADARSHTCRFWCRDE